MRTAGEMYQYCVDNKFGHGMNKNWGEKHFAIIEKNLMQDEEPRMCFIGLHNYESGMKHDNNFAYCITNKRILLAQKKLVGEIFQSIAFERINDVTMKTGMILGTLTIDTMNERFNIGVDKTTVSNINNKIHEVLEQVKNQNISSDSAGDTNAESVADEILKFKNLLDVGAITQEEYEKKKNELLG